MKNFNLKFRKSKKDQYSTCIAFKHITPEQQSNAKAAQSEHLINKEIARGMKETYKIEGNRNSTRNAFSLQKV